MKGFKNWSMDAAYGTLGGALRQTWEYMDRCKADEGHVLIFNRAVDIPWDDKIFRREEEYQKQSIVVWGL